jgi:hypothetical protein
MQREPGTLSIDLGTALATGNDAFGQCVAFKRFMRDAVSRCPDGAWLHIAEAPGKKLLVQVIYDPQTIGAESWAKRVQEASPEVWEQVRTGRVPARGRVA